MLEKHYCPMCNQEHSDPDRWESDTYDGLCESCEIEWCDSDEYKETLENMT